MNFENLKDLVNKINNECGEFCSKFQYKRKELLGLGRIAAANQLYSYTDEERNWAINKGGGTELQYHVFLRDDLLGYGLGFNTQYVPFANDKSTVEYMEPYAKSYLSQHNLETALLNKGFTYIYGDKNDLQYITHDKYILIGKEIEISKNGSFKITDEGFNQIINDLTGILFDTYVKIIDGINIDKITTMKIDNLKRALLHKKQIILQGPPGTGKTYTAKDLAEQVIFGNITSIKKEQKKRLEESGQFELVQFHPSYSYEDFVRGITAKSKGDKIEYVTEDRILASFAKKAFMNYVSSTKGTEIISKKEWAREKLADYAEIVQEKIDSEGEYRLTDKVKLIDTDENAFYYTGDNWFDGIRHRMKFNDIVEAYLSNPVDKKSFKLLDNISGSAKQHYGYYYNVLEKFRANLTTEYSESRNATVASERKYVMIIDEINRANLPTVLGELIYALEYRGESINSLYEISEGDRSITIPENLYIIGTMNTADRSVGHIDYAIRRRFAFKDILPDPAPIHEAGKEYFNHISGLFIKDYKTDKTRRTKSECLASDFKPEQVWLGHSYFITKEPTEENQLPSEQEQMEQKLETEILPILREYVSDGILLEEETKMHLLKLDIIL
ncbi:McrB family protein [Kaistella yonginensis]|uniref:McrB family protein n=1 Tax=Kaistella yonginensis TaxID=658267 RepID=UPI0025B4AA7E|nr:AAA family ATPase [Kaistella yonginensis]MDN3606787.1 AAA family ATPase [Kaistella yonginensis]